MKKSLMKLLMLLKTLMLNFLSRYSYKYPRSLVYMLQASEYNISDFLDWYKQVKNFNKVEKRKTLKKTPKAIGLLVSAWSILIGLYVLGFYILFSYPTPENYPALVFIIFGPYILPYLLTFTLTLGKYIIQKPIEYFALKKTEKILKNHKGTKIAIAGSFGKTSMKEILKTILSVDKKVAAPPQSYNTPLGISRFVKNLNGDEDILVFEFGEYYPGDIKKLSSIVKPDIGIITGINEAHLKKFKTIENTVKTIFEIKDYVDPKNLYINAESKLAKESAPKESILYSKDKIGKWKIKNAKTDLSGLSFTIQKENKQIDIKSKLIGLHQIGPLSAGIHIAESLNIPIEKIQEGAKNTKPFNHRLQPKKQESEVILIDDSYNGNPDGVQVAINFLSSLEDKRKIYVTPGLVEMGPKTKEVHIEIGKQLAKANIEKVILIRNSVTPYIEEGLKKENFDGDLRWFDTGPEAYNSLDNITIKGDVVLIQNDWPDQYN